MRNLVLYIATSLDGYIAKENHSLEWLFKSEGEGDNGYTEFYETIDTVLIGRKTYEQILILDDGNFPYKDEKCYVFSKSISGKNQHVDFVNADIVSFTNELKKQKGKDIWIVGGGDLLQGFLKENLVDEIIITIAPTIIGKGIPLFQEVDIEIDYSLVDLKRIGEFAQLRYELDN